MLARISALAAATLVTLAHAAPVTYQGMLEDGGSPANGTYDIRFDLYDDLTPGAPDNLIESETVLSVTVNDGRFTAEVPFSMFSFDLADRYVELSVRPVGGGFYTTLLPRQQIAEAPLAMYATRASSLDLPVAMGADPGVPNGVLLSIINNGASGHAIQGTGPTAGIIARGGDTAGAPIVTLAPAGLLGVGELTGVSGASDTGVGVIGATNTGNGGRFIATATGRALHAYTSGSGECALFEINQPTNDNPAVLGRTASTQGNAFGVHGLVESTSPGGYSAGVRAENRGTGGSGIGLHASHAGSGWGLLAESVNGIAVYGSTPNGYAGYFDTYGQDTTAPAVYARNASTESEAYALHGVISSSSPGSYSAAVRGENRGTGGTGIGVHGTHNGSGWGVLGESDNGVGVYGFSATGYAGYFGGDVTVTGTLAKGAGTFKIDHPLDPENKYLSHSFVESPDMKNIYDGVATLDADGRAEVALPDYFEALNENFRYQLTCLGGYAPVYIERKISANTFVIAGGTPGLEVSWLVTGNRKDAYARHNPVVVEQDKPAHERGRYLHPAAHAKPADLGIARTPDQH